MKRFIAILLIISILVPVVPALAENLAQANEKRSTTGMRMQPLIDKYNALSDEELNTQAAKYRDIANHFGKPFICKMSALDVIAGYTDGRFGPNDTLLACQFLTMVVKALGFKPEIPTGQPYWKPYVDIAIQEGLITAGEINDYTGSLTRELAAVIAIRALMLFEERPAEENEYYNYNVSKMSDYALISDKYKNDVVMSYRMGLLQGSNNLFVPKGTLTRAQGAVIVNKLIDRNIRIESVPQPNEIFTFTNPKLNEYLFDGKIKSEKTYTFMPGDFPLNEITDTVRAMVQNKNLITGLYPFMSIGDAPEDRIFSVDLWNSKEAQDKFYLIDGQIPDDAASFVIWTNKCYQEGALSNQSNGDLYSIDVWNIDAYNKYMANYVREVLKTVFGTNSAEAIRLHDYYLNIALSGKPFEHKQYYIGGRKIALSANGVGEKGFSFYIWAKGVIQEKDMIYFK